MPAGGGGHPQKRKREPVVPQAPSGCTLDPRDHFLHPLLCKKKLSALVTSATHPHAASPPKDILKSFSNPRESTNCNVLNQVRGTETRNLTDQEQSHGAI